MAVLVLSLPLGLMAGKKDAPAPLPLYIEPTNAPPSTPGSLWVAQGAMADLASDYKAHNLNDLIIIRIVEQTTSDTTGNLQGQRKFQANSSVGSLFGQLKAANNLQNLLTANSGHQLQGQADSSSSNSLNTVLAGRVVQVLPNGTLVIEASHEIEMNGQKHMYAVRGFVRPGDIAADNSVLSTQIGDLQVALKGKGVVSDFTRGPNPVVRTILRLLSF
jgi:flagellar L-ring protein precursor FlgH